MTVLPPEDVEVMFMFRGVCEDVRHKSEILSGIVNIFIKHMNYLVMSWSHNPTHLIILVC